MASKNMYRAGLLALGALLFATDGASAAEKASVRLKWLAQAQFAGFYVGKEKGFYDAEGIDLTINPGGPNLNAEALVASDADSFAQGGGVESQLSSRDKKLPIVAIAMLHQQTPFAFVAYKDSGIKTLKDFKGKKVSVFFTGAQFTLYATLAKEGLAPTDMTIAPQAVSMTPFINKEFDVATVTLYNEYNTLIERGIKDLVVFKPDDYGIHTQRDTIITSEKLIAEKPKLVQGFLNATLRGWKYAFQNKKEAIDIVMKAAPSLERQHQELMLDEIEKLTVVGAGATQGIGALDFDALTVAHKFLLENKAMNDPVDLKKAFDARFWDAVPVADKKL